MISVIILSIAAISHQCIVDQPHIVKIDDDRVNVGLISTTECQPNITVTCGSKSATINYKEKSRYANDEINYVRFAYFFEAQVTAGIECQWSHEGENKLGPFKFKLRPADEGKAKYLWLADMDISENSKETRLALQSKLNLTDFDGYIHGGDFAYDINDDKGMKGDKYFEALGATTARVSFMPIAGNHENFDNGKLFNFRYRMPHSTDNNIWYTVQYDTLFLFVNYDALLSWEGMTIGEAVEKIQKILEENSQTRWKAVVSHRPTYCGDMATSDCIVNIYALKPLDDLYRKHSVDIMLESHEHFYERLKVVDSSLTIQQTCFSEGNQEERATYKDCKHPVAVINGCAGNEEIFPVNVTNNGFTQKAVSGIQCFAEIHIDMNSLSVVLKRSSDLSELDSFKLVKDTPKPHRGMLAYYIIGGILATIVFSFLLFKASPAGKNKFGDSEVYDVVNNKLEIN